MAGLVRLLIDKGILTLEEYLVSIRLAMNEELARYRAFRPAAVRTISLVADLALNPCA